MAVAGNPCLLWKRDNIDKSNNLENEDEETVSDIWDDTALIEAYDRAVKSFKSGWNNESNKTPHKRNSQKKKKKKHRNRGKNQMKTQWQVGDKCQALYAEDGLFYDAVILSVNHRNNTFRVKFDYFNNIDNVSPDDIQSRDGVSEKTEKSEKSERSERSERSGGHSSVQEKSDNPGSSTSIQFVDGWRVGDICYAPTDDHGHYAEAFIVSFLTRHNCLVTFMKSKTRKVVDVTSLKSPDRFNGQVEDQRTHRSPHPQWPSFGGRNPYPQNYHAFPPFHVPFPPMPPPFMSFFPPPLSSHVPRHFQSWMNSPRTNGMSPPPPPPPVPSDIDLDNEEALASMLMSWYMVGYHTGYYQAQQGTSKAFSPFRSEKMDTDERSPSGSRTPSKNKPS